MLDLSEAAILVLSLIVIVMIWQKYQSGFSSNPVELIPKYPPPYVQEYLQTATTHNQPVYPMIPR